jgi:CO/xanthine dehydrogenase FAD-binding subunit
MHAPASLSEVLKTMQAEPGIWQPFAGGTDLMVVLEAGQLKHKKYLNIWKLPELRGITETKDRVTIGATTTYSETREHPLLAREFPMLGHAARETGAIAIQNRGTIGGNIANASPAADTPPALLAYAAEIELISTAGTRVLPYSDFHQGYKKTALRAGELVYRVHLPRAAPGTIHYYRKVGTRKAQAISKVCFAGVLEMNGDTVREVRIALGSIAATPFRCQKTEAALRGRKIDIKAARAELEREISPIDDIRSTGEYRKHVAGNLLEEFLEQANGKR